MIGIDAPFADPPEDVSNIFEVPVARIRRLRTVDGKPVMLVNTWLPMDLVPGLSADAFPETGQNQSILRILTEHFKVEWSRACEIVHPCAAPEDAAELLGVAPGTPILSQACTAYDDDQVPVFHDQVFRATPITYNLAGSVRKADPL